MIGDVIILVYNYFQLFILIPFVLGVDIVRSKRIKWNHTMTYLVSGGIVAMLSLILAIGISRTYFLNDELEIWVDGEGGAEIESIDYGSGTVFLDALISQEKSAIKLPYGIDRKINITAKNKCQVNLQISKVGYEDKYVITDNSKNGLTIYTDTSKLKLLVELLVKVCLVVVGTNIIFEITKLLGKIASSRRWECMFGGGETQVWSLQVCAFF